MRRSRRRRRFRAAGQRSTAEADSASLSWLSPARVIAVTTREPVATRDWMTRLTFLLAGAAACALAVPALAQSRRAPPPPIDESDDDPDIVVTAHGKPPGSVIGDIPPEVTLGPGDIRSYGVSSVDDLLAE